MSVVTKLAQRAANNMMKIAMAESMGSILSHFSQSNNQQTSESLEMEETGEASLESSSVELLTSEDPSSEKDVPELPREESADNLSENFADALTTQDEPVNEVILSKESPAVESIVVQSEPEQSSKQVNGDLQTKEDVQTSTEEVLSEGAETATPVLAVEKTSKETKKEGKKSKKGKDAEHMSRAIMQALNGLETPEDKIAALCKKYAELLGEHKSLQRDSKTQTKQLSQIQRERDHLQSEHGRALLAKSKLESLCRELQRHNKTIKEESLQRAREEDEKRKEVSNKFQQTINEITTQMQDNHTRNIKLKEENIELASKLKNLVEQYERREEHIEKLFKHKDLESQLYDAKLQQSNLALAEEKERNKREKELLIAESVDSKRRLEMFTKQEAQLKAQLAVYTEKFEEFQSTLTKSNEVFQTFKQEMDKMTKKIKKLEKETNLWRGRWETSNKSLMTMVEEKGRHEKDMSDKLIKINRLEKLCRALQAERNALIGKARTDETPSSASDLVLELNSAQEPTCNGEIISNPQPEANPVSEPTQSSPSEDSTAVSTEGEKVGGGDRGEGGL
ncbi:alpha-taxilin [Strongylocentrotus purpuratus]|uniref:Alpha-taxilin n=1 Tax=Strongylocentrotus purpuratus TaxID=7668 RepID=A0A7M7RCR9_STRPU|nr:alpha-taxilin [Strongylocentrotus purpuratus]